MEPIINASGPGDDSGDDFAILIKVPRYLIDRLDAEAKREQRSRTKQVVRIFQERYVIAQEKNGTAQQQGGAA